MGTTYYYTANNEMIGEHTLGQSRIDYLTDSLGSVVTTVDQSLTVVSTARYKPYGADLATTGTMPSFGYVGSLGYRRTKLPYSDLYVRKRHLASVEGRWTTVDPWWPWQRAYGYAGARPPSVVDPSGLQVVHRGPGGPSKYPSPGPAPSMPVRCGEPWNSWIYNFCNHCYYGGGYQAPIGISLIPSCKDACNTLAGNYYNQCNKNGQFPSPYPITGFAPMSPGSPIYPIRPTAPQPPNLGLPGPPPSWRPPSCYDSCRSQFRQDWDACFADFGDPGGDGSFTGDPVSTVGMAIAYLTECVAAAEAKAASCNIDCRRQQSCEGI